MGTIFPVPAGRPREIVEGVERGENTMVFYAAQNNRCHLATALSMPFVYLVADLVEGKKVIDRLRSYGTGRYAFFPEDPDPLIAKKNVNYPLLGERNGILYELATGRIDGVVVTCESLLGRYPEKERFLGAVVSLRKGEETDLTGLSDRLASAGYKAVSAVDSPASFRIRGDVLEVFPVSSETPFRVDFFGDEVESIRSLQADTRLLGEERDEIVMLPATDYVVTKNDEYGILNTAKRALKNIAPDLLEETKRALEAFVGFPNAPHEAAVLPFLAGVTSPLLRYADGCVLILDDVRQIEDKLRLTRKAFENRCKTLVESGKAVKEALSIWLTAEEAQAFDGAVLGFGRISAPFTFFKAREIFDLKTSPLGRFYEDIEGFFDTVKQLLSRGAKICVCAATESGKERYKEEFLARELALEEGFSSPAPLCVEVRDVEYGFSYPAERFMVVGFHDLSRKSAPAKRKARKPLVFELPQKGDYVVHETYGIGISEGMQTVKTSSGEKEYYVVTYRGGDKLYLPTEMMNTLEKYNGSDAPTLSRMGSGDFEKVKQRVRESVKSMAIDLLAVYKARESARGYRYSPDTPWQKELEDDFEFTETEDQLAAVEEIKNDMESGKVMDRLLCGDVGYGKTEVAIRAIFKTVVEGKQAAILAPTTILAQQHYNVLCARMNKFKLQIELLSRFVPPAEIKKSLERIRSGKSNIVVATHRLLGKDVAFHDLGLLVLDEEQRFGVEHKETLKALRKDVNVLSLSATPIPRTLHMALSGIRDISTLETPPRNRLPVETYVTEYSDELLKTALEKELARGGQAFVLFNRVNGIEKFYEKVTDLVGDKTNVVYAHGQMPESELENAIKRFYDGDAGVLVSTTIIENGVDLPSANTLFVTDADRLGLGQLYQLRGRVGRSEQLAYAYFTVREGKVLTENAVQRLDALMANTDLGSGFLIAMRDLEIRGAGNILGREQHGQMEKVGYELYLKLVREGIDEAQGKTVVGRKDPLLNIDGDYVLSETYVPDPKAKVAIYKTLAELSSTEEGAAYYKELSEKYGENVKLKGMIRVAILKNLAKKLGAKKVTIRYGETEILFGDFDCIKNEGLFAALEAYKNVAVFSAADPPKITFGGVNRPLHLRVKEVKDFLEKAATT